MLVRFDADKPASGLQGGNAHCSAAHEGIADAFIRAGQGEKPVNELFRFFRRMPMRLYGRPLFHPDIRGVPVRYAVPAHGIEGYKLIPGTEIVARPRIALVPYQQALQVQPGHIAAFHEGGQAAPVAEAPQRSAVLHPVRAQFQPLADKYRAIAQVVPRVELALVVTGAFQHVGRIGYDMPERRNFRQYVQTVPTVQRRLAYSFNSHIQLLISITPH